MVYFCLEVFSINFGWFLVCLKMMIVKNYLLLVFFLELVN